MASYIHNVREENLLLQLAKTIRRRDCILLIGLGLALPVEENEQLPQKHLKELLRRKLQWCKERKLIEQDDILRGFEKDLSDGHLEKVERKIQEYFVDAQQRQTCMNDIMQQSHAQVRYVYQLLVQMSFRAYLTTSYDEFLEKAYEEIPGAAKLKKFYLSSLPDAIRIKDPFILKLHGDISNGNPEGITLTNRFARSYLPGAISYPAQLRELLGNSHTLFIGFEKIDPDLEGLKIHLDKRESIKHWLLMPEGHITETEAETVWNEERTMILSYTDHLELLWFLRKLVEISATPQQIKGYISYVSKDSKMRDKLSQHLSIVKYPGLQVTWDDGGITPGVETKPEIEKRLEESDVILVLISIDYLTSINEENVTIEIERAVQRHHHGQARVIPILLHTCGWEYTPFASLTALPANKRPIDQSPNKPRAFYEIAEAIKRSIEDWAR